MASRKFHSLEAIFADDEEGLLDTAPANPAATQESRLLQAFEEINTFVDRESREPSPEDEPLLARRLGGLRQRGESDQKILRPYDRHGLLAATGEGVSTPTGEGEGPRESTNEAGPSGGQDSGEEVGSLEDIFADDDGLLDPDTPELYDERHVSFSKGKDRDQPEEIAQREACSDFWRFETLFQNIQEELASGESQAKRFQKDARIEVGDFFILDGMLCVVDDITRPDTGQGEHYDPRLRVVFSNGTESNLLLRSLAKALWKDPQGRRVILDPDRALDRMQGISHHDHRQGTIYILRSLRDDSALAGMGELYKIGYTEDDLSKRIAGAETSPTYLEAMVEVIATYEVYNANPHNIERLIHAVLAPLKLNLTLRDKDGNRYRPNEWFAVPLATAKAVVDRIADGTIHNYRLDQVTGTLVEKGRQYPGQEKP